MSKFKNNKSNKNLGIHTIFGQHSVKAALQKDKRKHIELIISKNHINFAKKYESKIQKITILPQNEFTRRFGNENTTQGVVLKTKDFARPGLEEFVNLESKKSKSVILILDQVTDPQNIGSIMRSCALFDCAGIIVGKDNSPEGKIVIEDKCNHEKYFSDEYQSNEIFKASDKMVDSLTQLLYRERSKNVNQSLT